MCRRYTQGMFNIFRKVYMPKIGLKTPKICPRYDQDMSKIRQRYAKDITNIYLINSHNLPNKCPRYVQNMPKVFQINAKTMPNIYPRYEQYKPNMCSRYGQDITVIGHIYA